MITNYYEEMVYMLHMEAQDKRRKESLRVFLTEIETVLRECNEERKRYKEELNTIKKSLQTISNFIKEEM